MHNLMSWLRVAAIMPAAALLINCGGDESSESVPAETLQLAMQDIAYDSPALTATRGETVRIELENRGAITHDFTIDGIAVDDVHTSGGSSSEEHEHAASEHDIHFALDAGDSGHLDFAPSEAGTYEYFCTVAGHREAGMRGTLTVE